MGFYGGLAGRLASYRAGSGGQPTGTSELPCWIWRATYKGLRVGFCGGLAGRLANYRAGSGGQPMGTSEQPFWMLRATYGGLRIGFYGGLAGRLANYRACSEGYNGTTGVNNGRAADFGSGSAFTGLEETYIGFLKHPNPTPPTRTTPPKTVNIQNDIFYKTIDVTEFRAPPFSGVVSRRRRNLDDPQKP